MDPDKRVGGRTSAEWEALSLEELRAEWDARPPAVEPPYEKSRESYSRLTRVRSEIFARLNTKPPGGTHGAGKGPKGADSR